MGRIMVVDDEAIIVTQLEERLALEGYEVVATASTGKDAVRKARELGPDLVLMDIVMPGDLDGINAARVIREELDIPVIFITAYAQDQLIERAKHVEPYGYILKPFKEHEVKAAIEVALYKKEMERRLSESEARYRAVVEDQTELICRFLADGTLTFVNPAYCRYFDKSPEELIGKSFMPFIPEEDRKKVRFLFDSLGPDNPVAIHEHRVIAPEGEIRWQRWTNRAIFNGDGRVIEYQAVGRDVTREKKLEEQLRHTHKMQAVGTLAGGIAHEFNNLLQAVSGYSELLLMRKGEDDPEYKDLLEIKNAAGRGRELTWKMLTFSQGVETMSRPLNLNRKLKRTYRLMARALSENVEVVFDLAEDLMDVHADPAQMEQLFMNLAMNAKDAMPSGGRMIVQTRNVTLDEEYCRSHLDAEPGRYVEVTIKDTGHGIDPEVKERIFEPFFTTREAGKGTGLGLAIVYGIVENHRGHITFESEPGRGSSFRLYLPAEEPVEKMEEEEAPMLPGGGDETILVVDDEPFVRDLGEKLLGRFGYTVLTAPDGESAVELYREKGREIDLVILDLVMPGMDGIECMGHVLRLDPGARILMATGYLADEQTREALKAGAKGLISKPYQVKEILKSVRDVLDEED